MRALLLLGDLEFLDGLLERRLQRLRNVFGSLGRHGLQILSLLRRRLDALADEGGLQLDDFGERLCADQRFEMREARFGVGAQSFNGFRESSLPTDLAASKLDSKAFWVVAAPSLEVGDSFAGLLRPFSATARSCAVALDGSKIGVAVVSGTSGVLSTVFAIVFSASFSISQKALPPS